MTSSRRRVARPPRPEYALSPWPFVGLGLMVVALFLYGASAVIAPWWAVVLLVLVWLGLFGWCLACWNSHPRRPVFIALGAMALWFVVLVLGGVVLNWG